MQDSLFEIRMPLVNGSRVKQARELRGFTQASLADELYIDQTMIAHIERGRKQPTADLLEILAQLLDFPTSFFRQADCLEMPKGSLLFRSKAIVGKKVIAQAHEYSRLSLELALRLSAHAKLIPIRVPSCDDPIEAAQELRKTLDLPDGPIDGVIRCIERLGVLVIPIPEIRDCDAFATWAGPDRGIPVIGLSGGRPADRIRLSAAHELGHLILHRSIHSATKLNEEEAYTFASEFVMPAADIYSDLVEQKISLFRLAELKSKWRVSMQAILRRSRELQIINDRQYRYVMMQISHRGWRSEEPEFNSVIERPRALRKISEVAFGYSDTWERLAKEFNLSAIFVTSVLGACEPPQGQPTQIAKHRSGDKSTNIISFVKQA
jgi:Zn-dependent peptidase ImmA (M78 family)/transcriptional regulator with XRE-family HTH domain